MSPFPDHPAIPAPTGSKFGDIQRFANPLALWTSHSTQELGVIHEVLFLQPLRKSLRDLEHV